MKHLLIFSFKKLKFLVIVLSLSFYGFAQTDQPDKWTLQQCIAYAEQNNLQVKLSELNLLSDKVELDRSKAGLFPTLNAGGGYSHSVGRSINPFTNVIEDAPISSQSYYINSSLTLFNGFSRQNVIKQNKMHLQASQYEIESTRNDISIQLATAYINILFNQELLKNAEARLEVTRLQRERTRKLVEAGALANATLYELQAQFSSDKLAIVNAKNNVELAKLNLKQLLQLPAGEDIEIEAPDLELEKVDPYPVRSEEVFKYAEEIFPAIKAADARIASSELEVAIAKGNFYPSITANAGVSTAYSSLAPENLPKEGADSRKIPNVIGYVVGQNGDSAMVTNGFYNIPVEFEENTYSNQLDYNLRRYVSLNLNIPIFNGFSARRNVNRARIENDRAILQAKLERQQLRQAIEQAANDLRAAALTYESTLEQVRSLREAFRSVRVRFNRGAANFVDFSVAKTNLDIAESNLIRAKYDYIFTTKILDFYLGKPLSF